MSAKNMTLQLPRSATRPHSAVLLGATLLSCGLAAAQTPASSGAPAERLPAAGWQVCQAMAGEPGAQLKCFQDWAAAQTPPAMPVPAPVAITATPVTSQPAAPTLQLPALSAEAPDGKPIGCRNDKYSTLSKFWELQRGTDCDTFSLRGYRPISLAVVGSDSVNTQPSSPSPGHTAATSVPYSRNETKIQLSVRTKIAKGLFTRGTGEDDNHDSLWFGYSQQSYWQLFSGAISRPFRNTDHEPEVIYIYPHQIPMAGGWNYRLSGLGLVHQSNGQSLPLSRSWNRVYLMGAAEKMLSPTSSLTLQGRVWQRLKESAVNDDNPGIENYVGRAELTGNWQISKNNTLGVTVRHSLRSEARGSTRIDWMMAPASSPTYTGLRYHVQLFSGYGDSLLDYNRKRTVLSVGLSLVDW
ncbi:MULTISPECIES: phospholipase A [Polaromonas]|uniref:Phospholipase A1 n=1 Tax=Polaromonas aquatica TaxID=332657 RepID=A0ABW1TXU2_9BURK